MASGWNEKLCRLHRSLCSGCVVVQETKHLVLGGRHHNALFQMESQDVGGNVCRHDKKHEKVMCLWFVEVIRGETGDLLSQLK